MAFSFLGEVMAKGFTILNGEFFDTVGVEFETSEKRDEVLRRAKKKGLNVRPHQEEDLLVLLVAFDEAKSEDDFRDLVGVFTGKAPRRTKQKAEPKFQAGFRDFHIRNSPFLTHPVFNTHHTETELLRYLRRLESRDLSLTTSMIPLGSCTMKLNATAAMMPLSWPEVATAHPFTSGENAQGYARVISDLERWLAEITGLQSVSLQPNAGAQGEYTGLLVIGAWHASR